MVEGGVDDGWLSRLRGAAAEVAERSRPVAVSDGTFILVDGR